MTRQSMNLVAQAFANIRLAPIIRVYSATVPYPSLRLRLCQPKNLAKDPPIFEPKHVQDRLAHQAGEGVR